MLPLLITLALTFALGVIVGRESLPKQRRTMRFVGFPVGAGR